MMSLSGTIRATLKAVKIPVMVIIRPRGGDFLYDELEFESMIEDVKFAKEAGAHGVVLGILTKDGEVDIERNKRLISLARPMEVTFHRAFDMAADPHVALDKLIEIGADRVLTSGQQKTALQGAELLADLKKSAAGKLIIMPGCGVNEKTVGDIAAKVQPEEVHLSALKTIVGGMVYRNVKASMSIDASSDQEYSIDIADGDKIKAVINVLEKC
ncbi:hypothetical protein NQZ79_g478 [Umbelopsis isabellina]|nr:hypothetical protein NQZ79_g478 [Umbelopsis isabellina]